MYIHFKLKAIEPVFMTITMMYVNTLYKNTLNVRKPIRYECVTIRTWTEVIGSKVVLIVLHFEKKLYHIYVA